jgi:hypothetical protein
MVRSTFGSEESRAYATSLKYYKVVTNLEGQFGNDFLLRGIVNSEGAPSGDKVKLQPFDIGFATKKGN